MYKNVRRDQEIVFEQSKFTIGFVANDWDSVSSIQFEYKVSLCHGVTIFGLKLSVGPKGGGL